MSHDSHYSPSGVASELASHLPKLDDAVVFDPAVGEGALLRAAAVALGSSATMLGADVDPKTAGLTKEANPAWTISVADALQPRSRAGSAAWREARMRRVDIVVMNPPFSYRGHGRTLVSVGAEQIRATPAMAFVATVLHVLRPRVGLFAILPRGAVDGELDRRLWSHIQREYRVAVHRELPRGTFSTASATSMLISICPLEEPERADLGLVHRPAQTADGGFEGCKCVEIVRGRVQVAALNDAREGAVSWVHTRDISSNIAKPRKTDLSQSLATAGPLLLLPRVGKFDPRKLAILDDSSAVLSDCLFGVRAGNWELNDLRSRLMADIDLLRRQYFGTGAPHMTVGRLTALLEQLGFVPRHVSANAAPRCWCPRSSAPSLLDSAVA